MTDTQFRTCWQEASNYSDCDAYTSDLALSSMWGDAEDDDIPQDRIDQLSRIWDVYHMNMRNLRNSSGLTQAAYAVRFCIPKRTVEDWDTGKRTPPDYVKILIARSLNLL